MSPLLKQLQQDYPQYTFTAGDIFSWSARLQQITYLQDNDNPPDFSVLLHELAHAELKHSDYNHDIELLQKEVAAWHFAKQHLAPKYTVNIDPLCVDEHLQTYREWLHSRSKCPNCTFNGIQVNINTYRCINCRCLWRINNARTCELRRFTLQDQNHSVYER